MRKLSLIIIVMTLSMSSCRFANTPSPSTSGNDSQDAVTSATASRYRANELRDYNGTHLDPAVGPRDNSIRGIQNVSLSGYSLSVNGLVNITQNLTYEEVTAKPSVTKLLTLYCVEGWDATLLLKGILMKDLLTPSEVKPEAKTIIFHGVDGYTTSLPLKEILDKNLMIAYQANGLPLPPAMGYPFIFVAENKWGYKWARWINRIELSSDTNYKGYWESLGYDNAGDK
ncbi:MAG: molybdopterin-dependent oxidoreductase [Saccharofermentanales bacterium]